MKYDLKLIDVELSNWELECTGRVSIRTIHTLLEYHKESLVNFEKTFMEFIYSYNLKKLDINSEYDLDLLKADLTNLFSNLFSNFLFKFEYDDHFSFKVNKTYVFRYKMSLEQCIRDYKIKKVLDF